MSSELPPPIITTEEIRFSRNTSIEKITVSTWVCKCGRPLGKDSAMRSIQKHGKIICGECAQAENIEYQEWLREREMMKCVQEA